MAEEAKNEDKKSKASPAEVSPEDEAKKRKKKLLILAIAGALLVIGGGAAAFFLVGGKKSTAEQELVADESGTAKDEGGDAKPESASEGAEKPQSEEEKKSEADKSKAGASEKSAAEGEKTSTEGGDGESAEGGGSKGNENNKDGPVELDIDFGESFKLQPFALNLGNALENRYIRLEIQLEYPRGDAKLKAEIEARQPQLRDAIISIVQRKTREFLLSPDGKDALRKEILIRINRFMSKPITSVYITDFLIE